MKESLISKFCKQGVKRLSSQDIITRFSNNLRNQFFFDINSENGGVRMEVK